MLAKILDQTGSMTFEGHEEKGPYHAPFPQDKKGDVCGQNVFFVRTLRTHEFSLTQMF
jgi:hypothetical protein